MNKPTFLENGHYRFLIMDMPTDTNIQSYIDVLQKKHVTAVVRACDATYNSGPLTKAGIAVLDVPFPDGDPPPQHVIDTWMNFVEQQFKHANDDNKVCIAVHCVAGLGRAPVLVAIALVESGMEPYDAIAFIRKKRRGAINARQLKWLENYKPRRKTESGCGCLIA